MDWNQGPAKYQDDANQPMRKICWPHGKNFAFTIVDDTDNATVKNIQSIYNTLTDFGILITKTVWPLNVDPGAHYSSSETLQNLGYCKFILDLQEKGHEIAIHGVRGGTSNRETIKSGLEVYKKIVGSNPRIHINHAQNLDNLYWGKAWIPAWKKWFRSYPEDGSGFGHVHDSKYFWGDIAKHHIKYVRGYVFNQGNTISADPYMPYHDPTMPFVNNWFSSSNGDGLSRMLYLTSAQNIDDLEKNRGACIAYTHFGDSYYTDNNIIKESLKNNFKELSKRNGWFVPVGKLLDYLSDEKIRKINPIQRAWLDLRYTNDLKQSQ